MTRPLKNFIVYKSSAGSGKTFTLVREYLKIVIQNPERYRQVLAITFTNKAANEMKERVVRNLILLSEHEKNSDTDAVKYLLPQLIEQTGLTEDKIRSRASAVLSLIMHNYADFAISTIDSFTHRVVRTFAYDLKIPMNFEVELDADDMLSQSIDLLISQVGSDVKLTRILVDFIEKKAGDEKSWHIENDLNEFGKTLLSESGIPALAELRTLDLDTFMTVRDSLNSWKAKWEHRMQQLASETIDQIDKQGLTASSFIQKTKSIYVYLKRLAQGKFDKIQPNSYVIKSFETGIWISPKAPPSEIAAFDRISSNVISLGEDIRKMISDDLSRYLLCKLLLNHLFSSALLSEIERTMNQLCFDNNKLLISEFNRRISEIVQEQPAPFIYERLGEKYHHYLIDEFQDTSILQWHNLLPLIENSLASGRTNLVVGDAKQAIYRWRSGDAEQFEMLPELIRDKPDDTLLDFRERALINNYGEEYLAQNHRSSPVIVDFNNKLFASVAQILPENYGDAFNHANQEIARKEKPGLVRIEKVVGSEDDGSTYRDYVHERIFSIIGELQDDNFPLRDLAILCRDNKKASGIASFLVRKGIPVISSESLLLTQSQQVNFLIAWIQYLADSSDVIPKVHIIQYLTDKGVVSNIDMEKLFTPGNHPDAAKFNELLTKHFLFADFNQLKNLEIFGLTQFLIFHFKLDVFNDSYLRFFQDFVMEFVKDHRGGLPEFLEWWEEKSRKASVIIPEGIDAVRIMTIHKAKGLQFPAVIYPFADEQVRPTRKYVWVPVEEKIASPLKIAYLPMQKTLSETIYNGVYEDEMSRSLVDLVNVLYVALTRPEERLYVLVGDFPEKTEGTLSVSKLLSRFFMTEGKWEKEKDSYQYGNRWQRSAPKSSANKPGMVEETISRRPVMNMLLRHHAPKAWDMEEPEKNREWGNLVHLAMSKISQEEDVKPVLQELLEEGVISSGQYTELADLMNVIMKDPEIKRFFGPAIDFRNEPEIITADGYLYRPDRVVMSQDGATIIDYKTGRQRDSHRDQLLTYVDLISEMKYEIEGAYLLYLNTIPEIVKVI